MASALCYLGLSLSSAPASAGNDDGILIGREASMMSGAVTATVTSGAAMWYNPAGLVVHKERQLDLGASAFNWRFYSSEPAIKSDTGSESEQIRRNSLVVPGNFSLSLPIGDERLPQRIGIGAFMTRSERSYLQAVLTGDSGGGRYDATFVRQADLSLYHIPITYAISPIPQLQIGISAQLVVSSIRSSGRFTLLDNESGTNAIRALEEVSTMSDEISYGIRASVGAQWQASRHLRLGVSWLSASRIIITALSGEGFNQVLNSEGHRADPVHADELDSRSYRFEPMRLRAGAALTTDYGLFSIDGDVSAPRKNEFYGYEANAVYNGRIGFAAAMGEYFAIGAGLFTDRQSFTHDIKMGELRMNYYGGTFGLRYSTNALKKGKDVEFGATLAPRYAYGSGVQGTIVVDTAGVATTSEVIESPASVHELAVYLGTDMAW